MSGRKARPLLNRSTQATRTSRAASPVASLALLVIDHRRLQGSALAQIHSARKRLEKASRDLHRHEEVDTPAYTSWLHRTFPLLVTGLRELEAEIIAKSRKIHAVQAMAYVSGRSAKRLWREQKQREQEPDWSAPDAEFEPGEDDPSNLGESPSARAGQPARSRGARDVYRRLVQHLHPDRGGPWTPARERLWHEVQQAWAVGDSDWLARLESDWESAREILSPDSPLSRLYRAIEELDAARRDIERKLSEYRSASSWRFTLTEKARPKLHRRTETDLKNETEILLREVRHLNRLISAWEEDWTRVDSRAKPGRRRRAQY